MPLLLLLLLQQSSNTCSKKCPFKQLNDITKVSASLYTIQGKKGTSHTRTCSNSSAHVEVNLSSGFYINGKVFIHIIILLFFHIHFCVSTRNVPFLSYIVNRFSRKKLKQRRQGLEKIKKFSILWNLQKVAMRDSVSGMAAMYNRFCVW